MYDLDFGPMLLFLLGLVVFFAVAAIFGWTAALWTGGGLIVASVIRYGWRS